MKHFARRLDARRARAELRQRMGHGLTAWYRWGPARSPAYLVFWVEPGTGECYYLQEDGTLVFHENTPVAKIIHVP